jgi:type II secretory pathway component PulC
MSETKKRIYMSLVVIAIGFWAYNNFLGKDAKSEPEPQPTLAIQQHVATPTAVSSAPLPAPARPAPELGSVRKKPWAADPFYRRSARSKAASTEAPASSFNLKAIIYNKTAPSAFLNNRVVRLGDIVDGAKVIRISKNAVILKDNGREITVTVKRG